MQRTQIYIPQELHQTASLLARENREPLAELLRRMIIKGICEEKASHKSVGLSSLTKLKITDGPKDLSANINEYLYGDKKTS